MAARILMVLSASIIFTLGAVHLVYTFWGPQLTPRDPALQVSMSQISPVITKETTMWRCWVGFNASHSMGLILFGLVFGFLALAHGQLLFQSPFLLVVRLATLGGFVVLSKVYWFSSPFTGTSAPSVGRFCRQRWDALSNCWLLVLQPDCSWEFWRARCSLPSCITPRPAIRWS
jgi:hypothetical protein